MRVRRNGCFGFGGSGGMELVSCAVEEEGRWEILRNT